MSAVATGDGANPPGSNEERVQLIDAEIMETVSIMQTTRTTADALPDDIASVMGQRAPFGMNPELSRRSIANMTNSVYVMPADGHICVSLTVNEGANLTCPLTGKVAAGTAGGTAVGISDDFVAVYGIVPDGVASVTVHADGADREVAVENNVYYSVVPAETPLRSLSYSGPSGRFSSSITNPRLVFAER